jgi:catalase
LILIYIIISYQKKKMSRPLTTSSGRVVDDNQNSITAGEFGPVTLDDIHLIDKLAHFDR